MLYEPIQLNGGGPVRLPRSVYTSLKSRSTLYTRYMIRNDPHGIAPLSVHTLYGPVQLNGGISGLSPTSCVPFLGSPAVPF